MKKSEYLAKQIQGLDDPAFAETIDAVTDQVADKEPVKAKDDIIHITEIEDQIKETFDNWGKPSGLSTGYPALDEKLGGLGRGHVILIGGETSNGKSALATNIAVNVAKKVGVLYITLEMLQREVGARIMHVNGGKVDDLNMMFQGEFRIDYTDVAPIIAKAKEWGEVEMVVLDYMQYLGRGMKLEEVAKMSKELKTLALKHEIPFIVIVSLRKAEQGKGKRKWHEIEIEDFMGTGSIGYDADTAMIVSRKNLDNIYDTSGVWIKVLKTRNAKLDYDNRFIRFDWDATKITDSWWDLPEAKKEEMLEQTTMIEAGAYNSPESTKARKTNHVPDH